jgi:hypothetical protein
MKVNRDGLERERPGDAAGNGVQSGEGHGLTGCRRRGLVGNSPRSGNAGRHGRGGSDKSLEFGMALQDAVNAGKAAPQRAVAKVEANRWLTQARAGKSLVDALQHFSERFFPGGYELSEQSDAHGYSP